LLILGFSPLNIQSLKGEVIPAIWLRLTRPTVTFQRWRFISYLSVNEAVCWCQRTILIYDFNEDVLRRFDQPFRTTPGFWRDNCTKARKSSFEWIQRFTIQVRPEFIAYRSEDTIHIKEYNSLTGISYKSSLLSYLMACRGA
jgi:hypothetical protein